MSEFVIESPMFDHEGNQWSVEGGVDTWLAPENNKTPLHTVPQGSRVKIEMDGHGPYREDGSPDLERGAVARYGIIGVFDSIEEVMIDDGLYEKHAVIVTESGEKTWVPFKKLSSLLDAEGKLSEEKLKQENYDYYAVGVDVISTK